MLGDINSTSSVVISIDGLDFALTDVCVHSNILSGETCTEMDDNPLDIFRNQFVLRHGICGGEGLGTLYGV